MPLFDTYVMVDWSARATPTKLTPEANAIWWAVHPLREETRLVFDSFRVGERGGSRGNVFVAQNGVEIYERTRHTAIENIQEFLRHELKNERRVLVGFDFAFGYPMGFAEVITGKPCALELWSTLSGNGHDPNDDLVIRDQTNNANNRFAVAAELNRRIIAANNQGVPFGPFWGFPGGSSATVYQPPKDPYRLSPRPKREQAAWPCRKWPDAFDFARKRITDTMTDGAKSVFQLNGNGSVGSQVLVGVPSLCRLRRMLRDKGKGRCVAWPFETGFSLGMRETPEIVIAEIYPSLLREAINKHRASDEIEDRAQVRLNALAFSLIDQREQLSPLFSGPRGVTGAHIGEERHRKIAQEEGWILGVDQKGYYRYRLLDTLKEYFRGHERGGE